VLAGMRVGHITEVYGMGLGRRLKKWGDGNWVSVGWTKREREGRLERCVQGEWRKEKLRCVEDVSRHVV
jgi:hypothetical protein